MQLSLAQVSAFHLHLGILRGRALCGCQNWFHMQKEGSAIPKIMNDQGTPSYFDWLVLLPYVSQPLKFKMMIQEKREQPRVPCPSSSSLVIRKPMVEDVSGMCRHQEVEQKSYFSWDHISTICMPNKYYILHKYYKIPAVILISTYK